MSDIHWVYTSLSKAISLPGSVISETINRRN